MLNFIAQSFSPKILLVEEAGQVLEAHIIGSLVPSVEHMILIGDPLQLRPNLANYSTTIISTPEVITHELLSDLSVDSKRGQTLYRFDVSLMERLSSTGLRMSQLEVQRRMRPCIAELIRYIRSLSLGILTLTCTPGDRFIHDSRIMN
jgi:superfamily I DNA and/or RNA helicase